MPKLRIETTVDKICTTGLSFGKRERQQGLNVTGAVVGRQLDELLGINGAVMGDFSLLALTRTRRCQSIKRQKPS